MLMRSLSPLLAPPNTCNASQFMSQPFPCGYRWHWRAAAVPGIYRGLSPPPAPALSSLCPCLLPRTLWHGKGLLQAEAAQASGMGWPPALTLPKRTQKMLGDHRDVMDEVPWWADGMKCCQIEPSGPAAVLPSAICISPAPQLPLPQSQGGIRRSCLWKAPKDFARLIAPPSPCSLCPPTHSLPREISHWMLYMEQSPLPCLHNVQQSLWC